MIFDSAVFSCFLFWDRVCEPHGCSKHNVWTCSSCISYLGLTRLPEVGPSSSAASESSCSNPTSSSSLTRRSADGWLLLKKFTTSSGISATVHGLHDLRQLTGNSNRRNRVIIPLHKSEIITIIMNNDKWSKNFHERPHRKGISLGKFNVTLNCICGQPIGTPVDKVGKPNVIPLKSAPKEESGPHLIYSSSGQPEVTTQTASQSVQPFLKG